MTREPEIENSNLGDMVLLLLPTSSNKLLAQWQGPFRVEERVGRFDYKIEMPHRRRKRQLFHVNLIKKWEPPCSLGLSACEVEEESELSDWREDPGFQPVIGSQLTSNKREELSELLNEFEDVLQGKPG